MHKFKFDPPRQQRRSIHHPKNQHVVIYNILDKCTQILREDRLHIRNQIKNGNTDVIAIFKQFSKPSQLQSLQIRLRKYVQNLKNYIKNEQLSKFKETLNLNPNFYGSQVKRQINQSKTSQSQVRPNTIKSSNSVELSRSNTHKNSYSQEFNENNMNKSCSTKHFQNMLKFKYNQEVIEERQSQNVTSARQARQEYQQTRTKPLQEQKFDKIYNKLVKPEFSNCLPSIKTTVDKFDYINGYNKQNSKFSPQLKSDNIVKAISTEWQFEKMAKKSLYHNQNSNQGQKNQQINLGLFPKSKKCESISSELIKDENKYDKYINKSNFEKISNQVYYQKDYQQNKLKGYDLQSNVTQKVLKSPLNISNLNQLSLNLSQNQQQSLKHPQKYFLKVKQQSQRDSDRQSLFTPLQLLNECRNFLKQRQTSLKKPKISSLADPSNKQQQSNKNTKIITSQTNKCMLNRSSISQQQLNIANKQEIQKEQDVFTFPQIKESNKKFLIEKNQQNAEFTHFQTFANFDHSHSIAKIQKIAVNFSIEDMIKQLMGIQAINPFIKAQDLSTYTTNHKQSLPLQQILNEQLSKSSDICITQIAQKLNKHYDEVYELIYPLNDKIINSVYDLLDIDSKGFINKEDINSFLSQINDADIDNYDEVSDSLWRLFDGADFTNEHRLTYWHFYIVKNTQEFENVRNLLSEFEFQIERNN